MTNFLSNMKKIITLLLAIQLFSSCNSDDYNYNNPYLPDYNFSLLIDMNLPLYSGLNFVGEPVPITTSGYGINGIIVMKTGNGYNAFEATCPNQEITNCSQLDLNGIMAVCPCDDVEYSLFTGQPNADVRYSLKPYRVEILGPTSIRVYN